MSTGLISLKPICYCYIPIILITSCSGIQSPSSSSSSSSSSQQEIQRRFALKTIFNEVTLLGLRELVFLRYLNSKIPSKSHFFVRALDAFVSNDQLSLVFKYYEEGTLMNYISKNPLSTTEEAHQSPLPIHHSRQSAVLQPKSIRLISYSPQSPPPHTRQSRQSRIPGTTPQAPSSFTPTINSIFMKNIQQLASKLISALWILKCEGIVHGDIKPENIFISLKGSSSAGSRVYSQRSHHSHSSHSSHSHSGSNKVTLIEDTFLDLGNEIHEVDFLLGDFGNAFLLSESMKFYRDFNIQSLPYRSPEILCGIPFNHQIDMWSVGIILLEICLGQTLFSCETREELFEAQCRYLTPLHATRFAGGRYSRDLFSSFGSSSHSSHSSHSSSSSSHSTLNGHLTATSFSEHYRTIYNLLLSPHSQQHSQHSQQSSYASMSSIFPSDLIHFIASLLYPDPDIRINVQDALQHSFISSSISIPMSLWNGSGGGSYHKLKGRKSKNNQSIETLRSSGVAPSSSSASSRNGWYSSEAEIKEE